MNRLAFLLLLATSASGQRTPRPCSIPNVYDAVYTGFNSVNANLSWLRLNTATGQVWQVSYQQGTAPVIAQRALSIIGVTDGASGRFEILPETPPGGAGTGQNFLVLDHWTGAAWLLSPDKSYNYTAILIPDAR